MKISESIIAPKGFAATGAHVGIKKQKKDLSLILSKYPCEAAACYTTNTVKAAPVEWDMSITNSKKKVYGIVTNSGNANACTGPRGKDDTQKMAEAFAQSAGCAADEILVCSTGVIGVYMPTDIVTQGITQTFKNLGETENDFTLAAEAIMTTDTFMKTASAQISINGTEVNLLGMAKGSGMIHPNMATMLSYIITDCAITKTALDFAVKEAVNDTFNMITVDADTSTNDTLLVLANGAAGNECITGKNGAYEIFKEAIFEICKKLATDIAKDGEGATKLMEVTVLGALTLCDARKIAKSVASSNLFKAALFGADANWGRVLCAMGYSGGKFDPAKVDVTIENEKGSVKLCENGEPVQFSEEAATQVLSENKVCIQISLNQGNLSATAWGCDLTYDYVKINGDYRS
ncbi:MAG: bifunctional glutamate N-acetyltransferase/amino-acid acetyltransferase ArgJ [Clostridiales bacterium]|jgi:glutamate N-acetyltransferase/amino-acid N-acetyltransferase|nr:bifunctional glutamate N-acetyltransferase/amino-acid acetyltransferase ArgJ [Clostridiales bacterium]